MGAPQLDARHLDLTPRRAERRARAADTPSGVIVVRMTYGIIYVATNRRNNKCYVGQTTQSRSRRWRGHLAAARTGSTMPLHAAIRKYGQDAFDIRTEATASCQDELDQFEIEAIVRLNALSPNGYNLRTGGSFGLHSDASKRRMSEAHRGIPMPEWRLPHYQALADRTRGIPRSRAVCEKISATKMGHKVTGVTREKLRRSATAQSAEPGAKEAFLIRINRPDIVQKRTMTRIANSTAEDRSAQSAKAAAVVWGDPERRRRQIAAQNEGKRRARERKAIERASHVDF